jgi:hypothetical protein
MGVIATGRISINEVCRSGATDERTVCIEGAIERMAKYHEPRARQVCEELGGRERATCLAAVRSKMYDMKKDLTLYLD